MSRLEKKLSDWVSSDLISREQAQKIAAHEGTKPGSSWVIYGFLLLGVVVIGIGIVSLVAANWRVIPDTLKLSVDFLLLIILAGGVYTAWEKNKTILFELLLISFMLLCLASIGLISQIYHIRGELYQSLLLWSVITLGAAAASKQFFAPFIWATGFFFGVMYAAMDSPALQPIFQNQETPVFMAIPLLCALLAIFCRNVVGDCGQTIALRLWTVIGGVTALVWNEFNYGWDILWWQRPEYLSFDAYIVGYALAALVALGAWMSPQYKKIQKVLLLLTLAFYLVPFHLPLFKIGSDIAYAICSIIVVATLAFFFASLKLRVLFQFVLVALGIRFLVLYFQALGGLAATGIGLIISGVIIIAMVLLWNKYRHALATWAEGLVG